MKGIIAGLIAAAGQASGVVLAKNGLMGDFSPLSGNVIRMTAAFMAFWLVTVIQGQVISTVQQAQVQRSGLLYILGGTIFGPLIGVSLSLFAIKIQYCVPVRSSLYPIFCPSVIALKNTYPGKLLQEQ
jgi:hypothetical protein